MPDRTVPGGSGLLVRRLVIFALARTRRPAAVPAAVGAAVIRTRYLDIQPADAAAVLVPHPS